MCYRTVFLLWAACFVSSSAGAGWSGKLGRLVNTSPEEAQEGQDPIAGLMNKFASTVEEQGKKAVEGALKGSLQDTAAGMATKLTATIDEEGAKAVNTIKSKGEEATQMAAEQGEQMVGMAKDKMEQVFGDAATAHAESMGVPSALTGSVQEAAAGLAAKATATMEQEGKKAVDVIKEKGEAATHAVATGGEALVEQAKEKVEQVVAGITGVAPVATAAAPVEDSGVACEAPVCEEAAARADDKSSESATAAAQAIGGLSGLNLKDLPAGLDVKELLAAGIAATLEKAGAGLGEAGAAAAAV